MVRDRGFEPLTPSVSRKCSTTELTAHILALTWQNSRRSGKEEYRSSTGQKSTRHSERRFNLQLDVDEPPSGLIICRMSESPETLSDKATTQFLEHLTAERGASPYTVRNYRQALMEFYRWHQQERQGPPAWKALQRDDFRSYLRYLGRHKMGRAATQLRFSALRSFYKFLIRR